MKFIMVAGIARVCHEANRAYCQGLGDDSQLPWDEAPEWQRESAILGVEFRRDNPDSPPSASHESWLAQKVADGWVYGEVKDPVAKTHPCMVPFDRLPADQQFKDVLFQHVCDALMPLHRQGLDAIAKAAGEANR